MNDTTPKNYAEGKTKAPADLINERQLLPLDSVKRILVVKLMHFGDVLLITPLLATLKLNYPAARIDVLVYAGTEVMISAYQAINNIYVIDRSLKKKGLRAQLEGERALFRNLNQNHYDLIVNLSGRWQPAFYCRLLKPAVSLAFCHHKHNFWWKFFHNTLVEAGSKIINQHTVLNNLEILVPLKLSEVSTEVTMAYNRADAAKVEKTAYEQALNHYILIQPTARWAFKTWPAAPFSRLINHLLARGENVVLTSGTTEDDRLMIEAIVQGCKASGQPGRLVNLAGQLTLTELAAFIDRAKLFIGVDSAPMHMAAALKTPSVVLFGPSNLKQWAPWQAPHTLIWAGDYRPLPDVNQVDTNTKERYLEAIPAPDVIKAVDDWLALVNKGKWEL